MLTPVESFWLRWHAENSHSPARVAQRVRLLRLAGEGAPPAAIAEALGVPEAVCARALSQFTRKRLGGFPRPALFMDELLAAARVDLAHAQHVARLALALFDATRSLHRLPAGLRGLLEAAARLHNVGVEVDEPNHHVAGRDLLRGMSLVGYSDRQQRMLACLVRFHRKKVRPDDEPLLASLSPAGQQQTLKLAALLRIADGLDYSQTQSTELEGVVIAPEAVTLRLSGPHVEGDAARARKKADLWRALFHMPVETVTPPPDILRQLADAALTAETPASAAARRALAIHLLTWQDYEAGALLGEPGAIKKVRGAARRLRITLEIFADYFKKKPTKRLRRRLREMESVLGRVRDLDIVLADVRAYQEGLPPDARRPALGPLVDAWAKMRGEALAGALAWLSSPAASDLQATLLNFAAAPPVRGDAPLREGARPLFQSAVSEIAERQAAVARGDLKSYHRLRLAIKQCRFTIEFIRPALPPPADEILADVIRMQDRLGAINDHRLLQRYLDEFLRLWAERQATQKAPQLHGAEDFLAYQNARRAALAQDIAALTKDWTPVRAARLRPRLNALLRALALPPPGPPAVPEIGS
jgi:CHAD domain-containing protein